MITEISDQAIREQALDIGTSFIVQAPAGSGKTELLTQRFLALLACVQNAPEEVLAITFTRKAASEMRTRIINALLTAENKSPSDPHSKKTWQLAKQVMQKDAELHWELANNPNRLKIQTIDSLCFNLAQQMPVLSEFGAQPSIMDNPLILYQQAVVEFLQSVHDNNPWNNSLQKLCLHLDNRFDKLASLLQEMLAKRDQWLPYLHLSMDTPQTRQQLEDGLKRIRKSFLEQIEKYFPDNLLEELIQLIEFASQHEPSFEIKEHDQFWQSACHLLLKKDYQWRKQVNLKQGFPAPSSTNDKELKSYLTEMKSRFKQLIESLQENEILRELLENFSEAPPHTYSDSQWEILVCLLNILPILYAHLKVQFQLNGQVDYIEIAYNALEALGKIDQPSELALSLDHRIQHILVDEFQDTSFIQFHLLERLTAGWEAQDGRTLFLVGDPMQSIYRFRKAEVGLFLKAQEYGLGNIKLTPLQLNVNFRSNKTLVDWFNKTFQSTFPPYANMSLGAIPFNQATAFKSPIDNAVNIHPCLDQDEQTEKIVHIIQDERQRFAKNQIAILVKSRNHLLQLLPRLSEANIDYQAIEIDPLINRSIIYDLRCLTKAMLDLSDRVSWLALLRAPWCGLLLQDLFSLIDGDHDSLIWDLMNNPLKHEKLTPDGQTRLTSIYSVLSPYFRVKQRMNLAEWIESIWHELHGPQLIQNSNDLTDAQTFFKLLSESTKGGAYLDLVHFEEQLEQLYASSYHKTDNPIQVMTIHKAKGLEFDTVILPSLERQTQSDQSSLLLWMERTHQEHDDLILAPIKATELNSDPIYDYVKRENKIKNYYETGRLLYVASTRARERLHLLATPTFNDDHEIKTPPRTSLLAQIWKTTEKQFTQIGKNKIKSLGTQQEINPSIQKIHRIQTQYIQSTFIPPKQPTENDPIDSLEYLQSHMARIVGTFIHQIFMQISIDGLDKWTKKFIDQKQPFFKYSLLRRGCPKQYLSQAIQMVNRAMSQAFEDPRARWIFDHKHQDKQAEYALSTDSDDMIIDRTFIDAKNQRWIIDFKTSYAVDANINLFLDREQKKYKFQLERYANAIRMWENKRIKLGLYFPLIPAWREWDAE